LKRLLQPPWKNTPKFGVIEQVASSFLSNATHQVLEGSKNLRFARYFAALAYYMEEHIAVRLHKRKATIDATKALELHCADEHTLVQYLRKGIPCNCLDEKYNEVKSITKMGLCFNDQCSIPNGMVKRKSMVYCTRCRKSNYCSRECQVANWPSHKELCDELVERKAKFNSKQKKKERQAKNAD
jgi:hypothetical protein